MPVPEACAGPSWLCPGPACPLILRYTIWNQTWRQSLQVGPEKEPSSHIAASTSELGHQDTRRQGLPGEPTILQHIEYSKCAEHASSPGLNRPHLVLMGCAPPDYIITGHACTEHAHAKALTYQCRWLTAQFLLDCSQAHLAGGFKDSLAGWLAARVRRPVLAAAESGLPSAASAGRITVCRLGGPGEGASPRTGCARTITRASPAAGAAPPLWQGCCEAQQAKKRQKAAAQHVL